jgi:hypothetical protein
MQQLNLVESLSPVTATVLRSVPILNLQIMFQIFGLAITISEVYGNVDANSIILSPGHGLAYLQTTNIFTQIVS